MLRHLGAICGLDAKLMRRNTRARDFSNTAPCIFAWNNYFIRFPLRKIIITRMFMLILKLHRIREMFHQKLWQNEICEIANSITPSHCLVKMEFKRYIYCCCANIYIGQSYTILPLAQCTYLIDDSKEDILQTNVIAHV